MTKLNWNRGRHGGGWSIERSPYRPYAPSEVLRGRTQHKPARPTALPAPATTAAPADGAGVTLAYLARHGVNRLSVWCGACRIARHLELDDLPADVMALPVSELATAVRCDACGASTMVTPFREGALRNA